ncbi:hypothetical protein ABT083_13230 [Streptomyces goshikiensis]|uniref:hypothetical protein n=1 Tax=Streptomyces goshikiensis TaxID=1942 RepID=UPI0033208421
MAHTTPLDCAKEFGATSRSLEQHHARHYIASGIELHSDPVERQTGQPPTPRSRFAGPRIRFQHRMHEVMP